MEAIDLRDFENEGLLDIVYRDLYLPNFPIKAEQEAPSIWKPLLWDKGFVRHKPVLHILVLGDNLRSGEKADVMGAIFHEFYPLSCCGLLTYLVVHSVYRQKGLARTLMRTAIEELRDDSRNVGAKLKAVFGEVNNPERVSGLGEPFDPYLRLEIVAKLGAFKVPIEYVQPELSPGQGRSKHMFLVVFPSKEKNGREIESRVLREFLEEFYKTQGVMNPHEDPDFFSMCTEIDRELVVLERLTRETA